jgi:Na+/melibiose symporter-like transporter
MERTLEQNISHRKQIKNIIYDCKKALLQTFFAIAFVMSFCLYFLQPQNIEFAIFWAIITIFSYQVYKDFTN